MSHNRTAVKKDRFGNPEISEEMLTEYRSWPKLSDAQRETFGIKPDDNSSAMVQAYRKNHFDRATARNFFVSMVKSIMEIGKLSESEAIKTLWRTESEIFARAFNVRTL